MINVGTNVAVDVANVLNDVNVVDVVNDVHCK